MSISTSRAHGIIDMALDYRAARQDMIASNIANADTPFYRPRDISFEETLLAKKAEVFKNDSSKLALAKTDDSHIELQNETNSFKPTLFFRDGHMAKNDGNSVDIDVETTEMSKNSIMFNALVSSRKKSAGIFRSVIEASQKVN